MGVRGNYRHICTVRGNDCAWSELVSRSARAIGSNCNIVSVFQCAHQSNERAPRSARRRATNERVTHPLEDSRDDLTIAMLTDEHSNTLIAMVPQKRQHLPVPQCEKNRLLCIAQTLHCVIVHNAITPGHSETRDRACAPDNSEPVSNRKLALAARIFHA